jgi:hypothetical protein
MGSLACEKVVGRVHQMRLVGWWRWGCLLLVGLHIVEDLQHCLHQLVLGGEQLFKVSIVVVIVAGLAIALVVPCVHHLMVC